MSLAHEDKHPNLRRTPPAHREYRRVELLADCVVHSVGVAFGIAGAVWLAALISGSASFGERLAAAIYAIGLVTMLSASAAYNMSPHRAPKGWLRRVDHSAIYFMIAGTYTPFIAQLPNGSTPLILFTAIWIVAIAGIVLKLTMPGRFGALSIVLYLGLGWSGLAAYDALSQVLDDRTWLLLGAGGVIYSSGVAFHLSETLPFHNVIWHLFVLTAAVCHYFAVLGVL
jgi:hemolysin III